MSYNYLEYFKRIIGKKRLVHLYLLNGEKGSGKTKLAFDVAYEILKTESTANPNLKDLVNNRQYPNLVVIEAEKDTIKKEQILSLQQEFNKTSLIPGPRVYIIIGIDKMTVSAANSLLKFMEEPQNKETYGFLLTDRKDTIIPTILSRSQVINLDSMDYKVVSEELLNKGISLKTARIVPMLTKDVSEAIKLASDEDILDIINVLTDFTVIWVKNKSILTFLNSKPVFYKERVYIEYFLNLLIILFLDILHVKIHQKITLDFISDEITDMSTTLSTLKINDIIEFLQETISQLRYYLNIELAITNIAVGLQKRR